MWLLAPLLFRQLAAFIERHGWNWLQGDSETIPGVTPFTAGSQGHWRRCRRQDFCNARKSRVERVIDKNHARYFIRVLSGVEARNQSTK